MGRVQSVYFNFIECECHNVDGEPVSIPAGRHIVTERDVVTVETDAETFELDQATFKSLKAKNIATHPL